MSRSCRLLPLAEGDGPWHMAADEVLLESAGAGVASLRFYVWSRPTLSLGYFQPEAVRRSDPLLAELPWVRRASGGAALVHHHEVTYALGLPASWQRRGQSWLCRMHHVIAQALLGLGVRVRSCGEAGGIDRGNRGGGTPPLLCFLHHTPGDLLAGAALSKVVGSAQRRQRGALLQHGGILLARSPFTPSLPGIEELTGRRLRPEQVARAVAEQFAREAGCALAAGAWTDPELRRLEELAAGKYAGPAWNRKR